MLLQHYTSNALGTNVGPCRRGRWGGFKVKTKIKQIFLIAFLQSPSHKHQKSVVSSKSVQLSGRGGCLSVQPAIGFCNACVQLLGTLQCPGGHGKPAAKSSSPPQAILRLATMCRFQVCLFGPSRRWQWPVSPLRPASVDHQGFFTALCLQIRLSWETTGRWAGILMTC